MRRRVSCAPRMKPWSPPSFHAGRWRIERPLPLGVRCIDALLTVGEGQRMLDEGLVVFAKGGPARAARLNGFG
mgnify:CR=1 FL=1